MNRFDVASFVEERNVKVISWYVGKLNNKLKVTTAFFYFEALGIGRQMYVILTLV